MSGGESTEDKIAKFFFLRKQLTNNNDNDRHFTSNGQLKSCFVWKGNPNLTLVTVR